MFQLQSKLYNLYTSDIPKYSHTSLALYVDDTATYSSSFRSQVATQQIKIHLGFALRVRLLPKYFVLQIILNRFSPGKFFFVDMNQLVWPDFLAVLADFIYTYIIYCI